VQALHEPALHTRFVPQLEPSARFTPASMQTEVPVEHEVVPLWHGFEGVQATLAVQETQVPVLHTWFVPQVVPSAMLPVSVHTAAPVAQERTAVRHGFVEVQGPPQRSKSHDAEMVPRCFEEQSMR